MDAATGAGAGEGAGAAAATFVESLISLQVLKRLLSLLVEHQRETLVELNEIEAWELLCFSDISL